MIHNLNASNGRQVYITWEIDWVPAESASAEDISVTTIQWLDVAGSQIYPVFDAEREFDQDGDGEWTFPDDVPTDPSEPGFEERENISPRGTWVIPAGGRTLVFGAGHLHPGGLSVDLEVARDGARRGNRMTATSNRGEAALPIRCQLLRARRRGELGREHGGDQARVARLAQGRRHVSIDTTYDVEKASWYESMGILPLAVTQADDPLAKDPFDDAAEVQAMYDQGGILTHGRLPENEDTYAGDELGLPDPRDLKSEGKIKKDEQVEIEGFRYYPGGFSAVDDFPTAPMRPPEVKAGRDINFISNDALLRRAPKPAGVALHHLVQGAV